MTPLSKKFNFWFCILQGGSAIAGAGWLLLKYGYLMLFANASFNGMAIIMLLILMAFGFAIVKVGMEQWPHAPIFSFRKKVRDSQGS